ncbi:hypothetical protein ACW50_07525 [Salmonella enterica subsp. enterica]|nr:hypothetical protein [Salmonella enterica subsp. enterica]
MIFKMPVRPEKCRCLLHEFRTSLVRTTEIRHVAPDTVEHIAGEDALPSSGIPGFECRFFRIGTCPLRIFLPDQFKLSRITPAWFIVFFRR